MDDRGPRWIKKVDLLIEKSEVFVLMSGTIVMALNSIVNVFGRYLFGQSLYFSEELNQFIMVIVTFYGLGYVTRRGRHIRMSAIYDTLPIKIRKTLMLLIAATTAVIMALLAYYAYLYVIKVYHRGNVTPALQIPVYLINIWVVIGFTFTAIQYLLTFFRNLNLHDPTIYLSYCEVDSYDVDDCLGDQP